MSILAWNCRGIGPALTSSELKRHIQTRHPSFLFLSETKNDTSIVRTKLNDVGFFSHEIVDRVDTKGDLAFAWESTLKCHCLFSFEFAVGIRWCLPNNNSTYLIGVYLKHLWGSRTTT